MSIAEEMSLDFKYSVAGVMGDNEKIKRELVGNSGKWIKAKDVMVQTSAIKEIWLNRNDGYDWNICYSVYQVIPDGKYHAQRMYWSDKTKNIIFREIVGTEENPVMWFTPVNEIGFQKLWSRLQEYLVNDDKMFDCETEFQKILDDLNVEIKESNGKKSVSKRIK